MFRIEFSNSNEDSIFVQVDPWACLYELRQGDRIEIVAESASSEPVFSIDEYDRENRILTLWNCDEFFIVLDGKRVHWTEFQSNYSEQQRSQSSVE